MTLAGEILESEKSAEASLPPVVNTSAPSRNSAFSGSHKEFRDQARRLAYDIVAGYVEHDRGHLDNSVEAFYRVYTRLFPDISELRAHRAAELYIDVLVKQDEIENQAAAAREQIITDPRWQDVQQTFLEFSRMLDLPASYAEQTTNYYRYHGVRDERYVNFCLTSDKIFTTRILGTDYWSKILGSLLLILTECHDKHDSTGLDVGLQFATKYFEIILRAKAEQLKPSLASA